MFRVYVIPVILVSVLVAVAVFRPEFIDVPSLLLTGGGALLHNLDVELERRVGVRFIVPERPMHCVITGTAAVLQDFQTREQLLIKP